MVRRTIDREGGNGNNCIVDVWREMQKRLTDLDEAHLLRRPAVVDSPCGPRIRIGRRELLCLCSNDYLGLASDPAVRAAAVEAIGRWGFGAGASRLISGTMAVHVELERRLGEFKRTEAAIVTSTGWMANRVAVGALAGRGDLVLCDKLDHASILDAAMSCGARLRTYAHRDTARLTALLERHRRGCRRCLIATDSLFSMDGDIAPLADLVQIKRRFDAQLLIDEAHATGVMGQEGRGVAEMLGLEEDIDATVGTLSKAVGALGGFVAGPAALIETIRNTGAAFIYTTAPPPAVCAAAMAAIDIIRDQPQRRRHLLDLADRLREGLTAAGLDTGESASQIIPVVIGPAERVVRISRLLLEEGLFVPAIRPPTVPKGSSRLRISLSAGHTPGDISLAIAALAKVC
ncbi:MAG: 8-amino-7-oxononanoate synthase [Phycisphaerae bacterium]|nr:8-amino-7-oxononanoate synthase [Phycisphaerae bacterium]